MCGLKAEGRILMVPTTEKVWEEFNTGLKRFILKHVPDEPFDDVVSDLVPYVKKLVDNLPHDYRQALILTEYEGLTQRELAERLGISISGAKSRVQRAREKVKLMLLKCCHFQFDRLGRIIDYEPNCACCVNHDCSAGCK